MQLSVTSSPKFGLEVIPTLYWGGMLLNTLLFSYTVVFMIPIGVAFALMRRSQMPVVSYFARFIIETFRGVPMVTLLFFSTIVLPMLLPAGSQGGKFTRVVVIVSFFAGQNVGPNFGIPGNFNI